MSKLTPFGLIRAEKTLPYSEFRRCGPAEIDGKMFTALSAAIHLEEERRLLEGGATTLFGLRVA